MKRPLFLFIFFLLFVEFQGAAGFSQETRPDLKTLTFQDSYQKVLAYYPRLKSQKAHVEEAISDQYAAYAVLLPRIQGITSVTRGDDPVYVFGSLLRQEKFSENNFALSSLNSPRPRTHYNFTLQAEVPLFNGFATVSQIRASKRYLKSQQAREKFTRMEASLLFLESYLKTLMTSANQEIVQNIQTESSKDLKQADDLRTKGVVLGADFYAAKLIASEIHQLAFRSSADEKTAKILINILMGEPLQETYQMTGRLPIGSHEPPPLEKWLETAWSLRADLAASKAMLEAKKIDAFRQTASALPKVSGFAALSEDSHDLKTGGENYVMGVKGQIDVLDAAYWSRRKKAQAAFKAEEADYQELKDQIAKQVSQAVNTHEAFRQNISLAEEALENGFQAVKQTETLYREGRKSIADLLEIRRAYLQAAWHLNELRMQTELTYANLLFAAGSLDDTAMAEIAKRMGESA